jgi:Protein of unknown function (DUF4199)
MPEFKEITRHPILIPVLIGGAVMALVSYFPVLNLINCLCGAGIMGSAVLAVWFYKKSYPDDEYFGPGDGAKIGLLSGIVGAFIYSLLFITMFGTMSPDFRYEFEEALEESMSMMEAQGQDPVAVEQASQLVMNVFNNPFMLFSSILLVSLLLFAGFGALGGAIGGKILKSKM